MRAATLQPTQGQRRRTGPVTGRERRGPRKATSWWDRKSPSPWARRSMLRRASWRKNSMPRSRPVAELRRLLDLNLTYLYGNEADRLLAAGKKAEALVAGRKAVAYSPRQADGHTSVGFLEYINGNKEAALREFQAAKGLDPDFKKQFDATISWEKEFKTILDDKDFLNRLFSDKRKGEQAPGTKLREY